MMKKLFALLTTVTVALAVCNGCSLTADIYAAYQAMDEITIDGQHITLVLPEDQAIPYRWECAVSTNDILLLEDKTIKKEGVSIGGGVSKAYRVYVFECKDQCSGTIFLELVCISSEDCKEVEEIKKYDVSYEEGCLNCIEEGDKELEDR